MTPNEMRRLMRKLIKLGCDVDTPGTSANCKVRVTAPDGKTITVTPNRENRRLPAEYEAWARKHGAA